MSKKQVGEVEYRVRSVPRYVVTRYEKAANGKTGSCSAKGEFSNAAMAYEVAYALCKDEHERLGLPPGDPRIIYPSPTIQDEGQPK